MDTLGSITPDHNAPSAFDQRIEALERLRYVAQQGSRGLLTGPRGSGKTALLQKLKDEFRREGTQAEIISLSGVGGEELVYLVASQLGFGIDTFDTECSLWSLLQDYAESNRQIGLQQVIMFDHIDRAEVSIVPKLGRLLTVLGSTCGCIFSTRPKLDKSLRKLLRSSADLRIELCDLSELQAARIVGHRLAELPTQAQLTDEAMTALLQLSKGKVDRLARLTELCSIAAEVEEMNMIDAELVKAVAAELG